MIDGYKDSPLGKIPKEWKAEKLGKLAKTFAGGTPKRGVIGYYDGSIPWIKSGEVNNNSIEGSEEHVTELALKESSAKLIEANSILVAMYGATAGKVGVLKVEACSNQAVLAVTSKNDALSNDFLYHYLKKCTTELLNLCQGSGQPNLSKGIVDSVQIPLPPLPEQQKIAKILSTVDDKIEVIDQQIIETQALKKGLMQRLLTKGIGHTEFKDSPLGMIPESWEVGKLRNLVSKIGSGITPKGGREAYLEEGVTFIRSQNVLRGSLKLVDVAFISQNQHDKMGNSKLQPKDVLLNITGASIGRSCVIPNDFKEGNVNQHVCIIRTNTELNSNFLSQLLNSSFGMNQIDKFQAGGNREGLNFQQIRSFDIPLPPLEEQEKIGSLIVLIEDKLEVLSEKKTHYQELKQGLMQQLLTGKIRVKV